MGNSNSLLIYSHSMVFFSSFFNLYIISHFCVFRANLSSNLCCMSHRQVFLHSLLFIKHFIKCKLSFGITPIFQVFLIFSSFKLWNEDTLILLVKVLLLSHFEILQSVKISLFFEQMWIMLIEELFPIILLFFRHSLLIQI